MNFFFIYQWFLFQSSKKNVNRPHVDGSRINILVTARIIYFILSLKLITFKKLEFRSTQRVEAKDTKKTRKRNNLNWSTFVLAICFRSRELFKLCYTYAGFNTDIRKTGYWLRIRKFEHFISVNWFTVTSVEFAGTLTQLSIGCVETIVGSISWKQLYLTGCLLLQRASTIEVYFLKKC